MTTSGGKNPGAPGAVAVGEPGYPLLREPFAPKGHHFTSGVQPLRDLTVGDPFRRQEDDLGTLY